MCDNICKLENRSIAKLGIACAHNLHPRKYRHKVLSILFLDYQVRIIAKEKQEKGGTIRYIAPFNKSSNLLKIVLFLAKFAVFKLQYTLNN